MAAAGLAGLSTTYAIEDARYRQLATEIHFWSRPDYVPSGELLQQTTENMARQSLEGRADPDRLSTSAEAYQWSWYYTQDEAEARTLGLKAVRQQRQAMALRPAYGRGWLKLIEYATTVGDEASIALAKQQLASLSLYEPEAIAD